MSHSPRFEAKGFDALHRGVFKTIGVLIGVAAAIPVDAVTIDLVTRTTIPAHIPANGYSYPALGASADGNFSVFSSGASNLVANDTNNAFDIFVYDASTATIERVSVASDGSQGDSDVDYGYDISADGRYVAFASYATNLAAGAVGEQVYLRDRQAQTTTLLSANTSGVPASAGAHGPRLSGDGHYAAFVSCAHDLVAADTSTVCNVFRRDLWANGTEMVSVGMGGISADGNSSVPSLSTDGRYVAFRSLATNLVASDTNARSDVFVRDMLTHSTVRASVSDSGAQIAQGASFVAPGQAISGDGRYVFFYTSAGLTPADTNLQPDVYVRDLVNNTTTLASVTPGGTAGNSDSFPLAMAANGMILFASDANDLDATSASNLYVYTPGASPPVSAVSSLPGPSFYADYGGGALSAYGSVAFFNTYNLLPGDTSIPQDYAVQVGQAPPISITEISASPASGAAAFADNDSYDLYLPGPSISADGRFVAFTSYASNLVNNDTNAVSDVFVRDRVTQTTTRISMTSTHAQSAYASYSPTITPDGRYISFTSEADLAPPDNNGAGDVYRYDRLNYEWTVVSVNTSGQVGNGVSDSPSVSDDGNVIVFRSVASNLVAGEVIPYAYIFARDVAANITQRVSVGIGGAEADGSSANPFVSGNGNIVCFESTATNLVSGISGDHVYAYDRTAGTTTQIDISSTGQQPDYDGAVCGGLSSDGRYVVFVSPASNLDPGSSVSGYNSRIYVRDRQNNTTTLVSKNDMGDELNHGGGLQPHISGDGRYVTFVSGASNYDPLASSFDYTWRAFVYDTVSAALFLASAAADGTPANDGSLSPHLSQDGKRVVFTSYANNLTSLDGNGSIEDVFVAEKYLDVIFASGFEACLPNVGCP